MIGPATVNEPAYVPIIVPVKEKERPRMTEKRGMKLSVTQRHQNGVTSMLNMPMRAKRPMTRVE